MKNWRKIIIYFQHFKFPLFPLLIHSAMFRKAEAAVKGWLLDQNQHSASWCEQRTYLSITSGSPPQDNPPPLLVATSELLVSATTSPCHVWAVCLETIGYLDTNIVFLAQVHVQLPRCAYIIGPIDHSQNKISDKQWLTDLPKVCR